MSAAASIFAPIKINLALHVGPPQANGYHPVDTLCVFPAIGDVLDYEPDGVPGIDFAGPFGSALAGEGHRDNLVWRAFAILGVAPRGRFLLHKRTPIASGVGAGTADGAAAMLLLNDVLGLGLDADALTRRAIGLGADGPVCIAAQMHGGGVIRARGIGERIEVLGRCEAMAMLVANPGMPVPTGDVFRRFDAEAPARLDSVSLAGAPAPLALLRGNRNDLQPPAQAMQPAIAGLLATLEGQPGALAARMSGSGATCYALHASLMSADRAARVLRARGIWAEAAPVLPG